MACGTSSARRSTSRSTSCSAATCTSGCAATPTSTRPGDATDAIYPTRTSPASARPSMSAQGFTALKFDPAGRYASFDPRQPRSSAWSSRRPSAQACARRSAARPTSCSARTASSPSPARSGSAKRLETYEPLWFEEPVPPEMPEEMAARRARTSIPVATGERLTTKYEFARVLETGAASILQMNLGRVGGLLEAKKIAGMAEAHYAQIAPHLYCGPVVGAANIQLAACSPELPDPGEHPRLGRLPRADPQEADPLGGRLRDPADGAGARRRARRGRGATRTPTRARSCI